MIEIPTIKLELYQQDPQQFSQQLGQALETLGVAQVDGFKQHLVDELYENSEEAFARYKRGQLVRYLNDDPNKNLGQYVQTLVFTELFTCTPTLDPVAGEVKQNLKEIYEKVTTGLSAYKKDLCFYPFNHQPDLILRKYSLEGDDLSSPENAPTEIMVIKEHYDASKITIAPKATAPGLEGYIDEEWVPLSPDHGNALIFTGNNCIRPLKHRVMAYSPFAKLRKTLICRV